MESYCINISAHGLWKEAKKEIFQEKLLRHISCTRWPMWRKFRKLDGWLHPLTSGRDFNHWMCSHGCFGLSVFPFPCWIRRHMFVFPSCILGDIFDASFYYEHPRNTCLLDDAYPSCGWTWDFTLVTWDSLISYLILVCIRHIRTFLGYWRDLFGFGLTLGTYI